MGTRETDQPPLWIATSDLPTSPGHPFYARLTTLLDGHHVDRFVEGLCDRFYAPVMGRPSVAPGRYFRLLLVGYFEGIDSERGIAWRATDSLAVRSFLRLAVDEAPPDHSTIARTRRWIDLETHRTVFTWVQQRLVEPGRLKGKTIAIDATTLEANAAMRSIVRRDTGESDQAFLAGLAKASGVETPTREGLARLDRKRKKKTSNKDWTNPHDPDAKVTKMKDGRTHRAHKAEHAVDMETGAIVAVTLQGADVGDTTTIIETAIAAAEQVEDAQANVNDRQSLEEIVGDKGYHSNQTLIDLDAVGIRSYVSEPDRGRRDWSKDQQLGELLEVALEGRQRVRNQLHLMAPGEYGPVVLTGRLVQSGRVITPTLPDAHRQQKVALPSSPQVGEVIGLAVIGDDRGCLLHFEMQASKGSGRIISLGSMQKVMKGKRCGFCSVHQDARSRSGPPERLAKQLRHSRTCDDDGRSQGGPVSRNQHHDGNCLRSHGAPRPQRCRYDRRDYA